MRLLAGHNYAGTSLLAVGFGMRASARAGAAPTQAPVVYWPGTASLQGSFTPPTSSISFFASFTWPEASPSGDTFVFAVVDGRYGLRIRSDGSFRVDLNQQGRQNNFSSTLSIQPGQRITVYAQAASDNVSRPFLVYQIEDQTPVLALSRAVSSSFSWNSGSDLYFGRDNAVPPIYSGTIHGAAIWLNTTPKDTYSETWWRKIVAVDGSLADRQGRVDEFGTPAHEPDLSLTGANAGTNLGSGADYTVTGTFALGVASTWFDLSTTLFDASAASGTAVASIETDGTPAPFYALTSNPGGHFEIVSGELRRTSTTVASGFYPIEITETQATGTVARQFNLWAGQSGQDSLQGRAAISTSRTSVFKDEHVWFEVTGLTEAERGYELSVVFDFGDNTEVYQNVPTNSNVIASARYKRGHMCLHTFTGSTGTRTVNVSIYRTGSATAVWTGSVDITVKDPATISNVHVVATSGFTGLPAGTQHTTTAAALQQAWAQVVTGSDAIVYLKRGDQFSTGNNVSLVGSDDTVTRGSLLVRAAGSGAQPVVTYGANEDLRLSDQNDTASVSISDIDPRGNVDIFAPIVSGEAVYPDRALFVSVSGRGHVTLSRITGQDIMLFSHAGTGGDDTETQSFCVHDPKSLFRAPYSVFMGVSRQSGQDGGIYDSTLLPNVAKQGLIDYLGASSPDNPGSYNGASRITTVNTFVMQNALVTNFLGWSAGDRGDSVPSDYRSDLSKHQPCRLMSSGENASGGSMVVSNCQIEGDMSLTSASRTFGHFVVKRCYQIAHAGAGDMWAVDHRGLWFLNNIQIIPNVLSEQGGPTRFMSIDQNFTSDAFAGTRQYRNWILGNTFVDLRASDKLEPNEDGTAVDMLRGIDQSFVMSEGNVLLVPNRTISDPNIDGVSVYSGSAAQSILDDAVTYDTYYRGLLAPHADGYGEPLVIEPVNTTFATPSAAGIAARATSGYPAWSGSRQPAEDFTGAVVTGSGRKAGAHSTSI